MDPWIAEHAERIAARAEADLGALVAVPSPTGDRAGADAAAAQIASLLPARARIARPTSSTPGYADDLRARLDGSGQGRLLLLGHLDTVSDDGIHRRLRRSGTRLHGTGTYDMKGGLVIACGVMRALATAPERYERADLLVVADEEWRTSPLRHVPPPGACAACLTFEGGERVDGTDAVVVRRKAAHVLRVAASGAGAHAGAAAGDGRSALLALAGVAQQLAGLTGPDGLTVVPTVLNAGRAINAVPGTGELVCDVRSFDAEAIGRVVEAVPARTGGVSLATTVLERFPAMDTRAASAELLAAAAQRLGRPLVPAERGGSSDAAFCARSIACTVDGLGPLGGGDHSAAEHVEAGSFAPRSEVALAVALAALEPPRAAGR